MTQAWSPPPSAQWASREPGCQLQLGWCRFSDIRPAGRLQGGLGDVAQLPSRPVLPFGTVTSLAIFKVSEQRCSRDAVVRGTEPPTRPLPVLGSDPTATAGEVPPAHSSCPPPPWRTTPPPAPARSVRATGEQALGPPAGSPAWWGPGGGLVTINT